MFIAGQRTWSRSGATLDAIDPATAAAFTTMALADSTDVDTAVTSARAAFEGWAGLPPVRRGRVLHRIAGLLRGRRAEFAELESLGAGTPPNPSEGGRAAAAGY